MIAIVGLIVTALAGLMFSRHLLKVIMAIQIMTQGVLLALLLAGDLEIAQSRALMVLVADAVVISVGLALVVQIHHRTGSLDVADLSKLKG